MKTTDSVSRRRLMRGAAATALFRTALPGAQLIQKSANSVDPAFDGRVAIPAYATHGPKVLLDQGHFNLVTAVGECVDLTFAKLIAGDGYSVVRNTGHFDARGLRGVRIVVMPIAAGGNTWQTAASPALTDREVETVFDWIRRGGSLLLMFDHYPFDAAIEGLASRLGLNVSRGRVRDANAEVNFSRDRGLQRHPITEGRHSGERLTRIVTFGGSSFTASDPGSEFLKMPASAKNVERGMSGLGRTQGAAFRLGKGRVVALADTNMAAAQLAGGDASHPTGFGYPGADNRQLVLNCMHWLSGLLE